jgi:hypothetical protein
LAEEGFRSSAGKTIKINDKAYQRGHQFCRSV